MKINFKSAVAGLALTFAGTPLLASPMMRVTESAKVTTHTTHKPLLPGMRIENCTCTVSIGYGSTSASFTATAATCDRAFDMAYAGCLRVIQTVKR